VLQALEPLTRSMEMLMAITMRMLMTIQPNLHGILVQGLTIK
jgi:hypothetical protein